MNTGFAYDGAVFLMVPDDQFTELLALAKVEIKSKSGHTPLDVGQLGDLANSMADAGDNTR